MQWYSLSLETAQATSYILSAQTSVTNLTILPKVNKVYLTHTINPKVFHF